MSLLVLSKHAQNSNQRRALGIVYKVMLVSSKIGYEIFLHGSPISLSTIDLPFPFPSLARGEFSTISLSSF